jgi:hypothetical protein
MGGWERGAGTLVGVAVNVGSPGRGAAAGDALSNAPNPPLTTGVVLPSARARTSAEMAWSIRSAYCGGMTNGGSSERSSTVESSARRIAAPSGSAAMRARRSAVTSGG